VLWIILLVLGFLGTAYVFVKFELLIKYSILFIQTIIKIIDNTGGFYAKCIGVLTNSKLGRVGDQVVISVKSVLLNKKVTHHKKRKVLKGTVRRAVLLKTS
jgi:ribosomal protein L14